jgi:hypothetical protein
MARYSYGYRCPYHYCGEVKYTYIRLRIFSFVRETKVGIVLGYKASDIVINGDCHGCLCTVGLFG